MNNGYALLKRVDYSRTMGRDMVIFLGRDCHFFRTSWLFHKLGRVGHVLRSPFNKFGKLKILGVCIL